MTPDDAIRAFRKHLLAGAYGDRELLMPWEARFGYDHPVIHAVRSAIHTIADRRPDAVKIFALATTRYGREGDAGK